jgi:hypothetical protein
MMVKKRWQDLTVVEKIGVALMGAVQLLLLVAALWDIRRQPTNEIKGSKRWWTAAVFVNFIGPISYFLFGKKKSAWQLS